MLKGKTALATAATPSKPIPVMRFNIVVTPSGIKIVPVCRTAIRQKLQQITRAKKNGPELC
jgi:hypothetical protein